MEMDHFPLVELPSAGRVVFVVATTGEGEPPKTMMNFWKVILRRGLPTDALQDVKFTVFGLGDSSYKFYNSMAKKLAQRMKDLGASLVHPVGLGDA